MPTKGGPRGGQVAGFAALSLAVCWGLPALFTVAAGMTVAGLGLRTWLVGGAGLVVVGVAGVWRSRRRAHNAAADCHFGGG
jgi:hypothetical protein